METPSEPILHVDMDAFYASVEQREDPTLAGKPLAVGGTGPRSVVASCSYEAREYGVRSAMPMMRARRMCPELVIVSPDFGKYGPESAAIRRIFESFTPHVEMLSLDEAFLDVSGAVRLFGDPVQIGERIRERIRTERNLIASVGVAANKSIAKLASVAAKPDGLVHVPAEQTQGFLDPLPVSALWGVGEQTAISLDRLGVRTIEELRRLPDAVLDRAFGPASAQHLWHAARGIDERPVVVHEAPKQVSAEETFERDIDSRQQVRKVLLALSDRVASRMREQGAAAKTVTLKVRFNDFRTITRSKTIATHTDAAAKLYGVAGDLYDALGLHRPRIRLLGISASGLSWEGVNEQLRLDERPDPWRAAEAAVDRVRGRYGRDAVDRAAVAKPRPPARRQPPPLPEPRGPLRPGTVERLKPKREEGT
ncbi:MAG: DNA polymerase IV [Actinomycetota bacterium]